MHSPKILRQDSPGEANGKRRGILLPPVLGFWGVATVCLQISLDTGGQRADNVRMRKETKIQIRLTAEEKDRFTACADAVHLTLSAWMRQSLHAFADRIEATAGGLPDIPEPPIKKKDAPTPAVRVEPHPQPTEEMDTCTLCDGR